MAEEPEKEIGKTGNLDASNTQTPASTPAVPENPGAAASVPVSKQSPTQMPAPSREEEVPLRDDIARILSGVKLPERREAPGTKRVIENTPVDPVVPEATPAAAPPALTPEEAESAPFGAVHTLKQDLQEVVRDNKISLVSAVSLEQSRKRPEPFEAPAKPRRNVFGILFAVVILLALGLAALGGVYYVVNQGAATPAQNSQNSPSLVFAEQTAPFAIGGSTPTATRAQLAQARETSSATLGSITRVVPRITGADGITRDAAFSEFMTAIGAHPPQDLLRALSDDFFFGIHTVDKNAPILVISVTSYDQAFAGMLAWEKTMNADLSPIFTSIPEMTTDQNGLQTFRTFSDLVMRNYDVRALKDDAGNVELYYSFPTRGILIIAESPYSFTEVLSRLQAGRRL